MTLSLLTEPLKWRAVHKPLTYTFDYAVVLDTAEQAFGDAVVDVDGKMAYNGGSVYLDLPFLQAGDRYYVATNGGTSLYQQAPTTIKEVRKVGSDYFIILNLPTDGGVTSVELYAETYYLTLLPKFRLYVDGVVASYIRYVLNPNGLVEVNVSDYLKPFFDRITPPVSGTDNALFKSYSLEYGEGESWTPGTDRFVLNAVVQPDSIEPVFIPDVTTIRCKFSSPRASAVREAKHIDSNPCSATFGGYESGGAYFDYDTNTTACPIDYYVYALYERHADVPSACGSSVTPTNYYSASPTFVVGTRLFSNITLTTEILSGFYKRQDVNAVIGYTPGLGNGIDSFVSC